MLSYVTLFMHLTNRFDLASKKVCKVIRETHKTLLFVQIHVDPKQNRQKCVLNHKEREKQMGQKH